MNKQKRAIVSKTDYSKIAKYYDKVRTKPGTLLSQVIKYGKIDSYSTVLDIGCGTGRFPLSLFSISKCSLLGVDISLEMLREASLKDKGRIVDWIHGDGQRLPFPNDIFDCVYLTFVLHHVENRDLAFEEIYRVLKKGGRCVILTTSHSQIRRHVLNDFPGVTAIDLKRFPSVLSLKRSMLRISFRNVHHHPFQRLEVTSTSEYLERVRNKYVSTLTLFSDNEFQERYKVFKQKVKEKYGDQLRRFAGFIFVEGRK